MPGERMRRQKPFLESILREANGQKRQALLDYANKDQINALSELALNVVRKRIPVSPQIVRQLFPYKDMLRTLGRRKVSIKRRKALLATQKGGAFWKGLECCYRLCHK